MKVIDIEDDSVDIYVDGQLVLHIGQVSDDKTINLFLYPSMGLMMGIISALRQKVS